MISAVLIHPTLPMLAVPSWVQIGVFIAVVGISGWLGTVLPKHPKLQTVTIAVALAFLLALALVQGPHLQARYGAFMMEFPCWGGWWTWGCWI